jgi:hypothetical protein
VDLRYHTNQPSTGPLDELDMRDELTDDEFDVPSFLNRS